MIETTDSPPAEEYSGTRSLLSLHAERKGLRGSSARRLEQSLDKTDRLADFEDKKPDIIVTGSGNLGNVWLNHIEGRASYDDIMAVYPSLLPKLLKTNGIGLLIITTSQGPVCYGPIGNINLLSSEVDGKNPLEPYPVYTRQELLNLATKTNAPDIIVISSYNRQTGEVHAFEELVGNHGGIGGWQTQGVLLYPAHLGVPPSYFTDGRLHDSVTLHKLFVHWLEKYGHRQKL